MSWRTRNQEQYLQKKRKGLVGSGLQESRWYRVVIPVNFFCSVESSFPRGRERYQSGNQRISEQYQTLPMKRNPKGTSYYSVAKLSFRNDTMLQLNQWAMISLMSPLWKICLTLSIAFWVLILKWWVFRKWKCSLGELMKLSPV